MGSYIKLYKYSTAVANNALITRSINKTRKVFIHLKAWLSRAHKNRYRRGARSISISDESVVLALHVGRCAHVRKIKKQTDIHALVRIHKYVKRSAASVGLDLILVAPHLRVLARGSFFLEMKTDLKFEGPTAIEENIRVV